jgi:hypothetical protein
MFFEAGTNSEDEFMGKNARGLDRRGAWVFNIHMTEIA